ncbi:hypothetical protein NKH98_28135 [Mesorhizobium sp. M0833]|uniref:transposase DNA-binding-containing protein n=1 Tax=Mesorhizobium sp. M0833 TaxID=2957009 RepID=UPI00333C08C3
MRDKTSSGEAAWQEEELSTAALPDKRLACRLRRLLDQRSAAPGKPVPTPWAGRHRITVDQNETTRLQVKFAAINTLPPVGKQKRYSPQVLTYIHALEEDPPPGREPIDWKLVTNLPVEDLSAAVEKLGWHALRWKAEVFHRAMKSGCRAEEARLEIAERLAKFLALIPVVSWRMFFITMSGRVPSQTPRPTAFSPSPKSLRSTRSTRAERDHTSNGPRSPPTCCKSPCLAATSPANMTPLLATWSSGAA